jgi:hypothetical protein
MCVLGDYPYGGSGRDPDTDHDQIQEHDLDCIGRDPDTDHGQIQEHDLDCIRDHDMLNDQGQAHIQDNDHDSNHEDQDEKTKVAVQQGPVMIGVERGVIFRLTGQSHSPPPSPPTLVPQT